MEDLNATGVSLLDFLRVYASCAYLSDLHYLSSPQRMCLAWKLGKLLPESFSLWQWNDALTYLVGTQPAETAETARMRLLAWLSRPLDVDTEPEAVAV